MTTLVEVEGLGGLLTWWRVQARLSLRGLAERASALLPEGREVSFEMLRRAEHGETRADGMDPAVLAAVTLALGRNLDELPESDRARIDAFASLLDGRTPPLPTGPIPHRRLAAGYRERRADSGEVEASEDGVIARRSCYALPDQGVGWSELLGAA